MPFDKFDFETLSKERRKAIAKSVRSISVEELKKMGEELFKYADDDGRLYRGHRTEGSTSVETVDSPSFSLRACSTARHASIAHFTRCGNFRTPRRN
jgi:DNA topoisomerase IB